MRMVELQCNTEHRTGSFIPFFIIVSAFYLARELKRNGRERKEARLNSSSNTTSRVFNKKERTRG